MLLASSPNAGILINDADLHDLRARRLAVVHPDQQKLAATRSTRDRLLDRQWPFRAPVAPAGRSGRRVASPDLCPSTQLLLLLSALRWTSRTLRRLCSVRTVHPADPWVTIAPLVSISSSSLRRMSRDLHNPFTLSIHASSLVRPGPLGPPAFCWQRSSAPSHGVNLHRRLFAPQGTHLGRPSGTPLSQPRPGGDCRPGVTRPDQACHVPSSLPRP